jgi:hypothetical protein
MNPVAQFTLGALGTDACAALPTYCKALERACDASPPPFGTQRYGDIFRMVATDPTWLATSLITNAEREAEGATRLWSIAASTPDTEIAALVKQHAIDESRHSRWYIAVLDVVFPGALDESLRPYVEGISPRYSATMAPQPDPGSPFSHAATLDDLVQMNIAEIRTAINQRLQLPVLTASCRPGDVGKLTPLMAGLIRDEVLHVAYSARLIEKLSAVEGADTLTDLITERVRDFNEITCEEVEMGVFPLHCSSKRCSRLTDPRHSCPRREVSESGEQ